MTFIKVLAALMVLLLKDISMLFDVPDAQSEYSDQNHKIRFEINKNSLIDFDWGWSAPFYLHTIQFPQSLVGMFVSKTRSCHL